MRMIPTVSCCAWGRFLVATTALAACGTTWSLGVRSLARVYAAESTATMVEVTGEGAKYWPRWRGPSGQGLVKDKGYPDTWSDTENVRWKAPVPGRGNSSPIVW